MLPSRLGRGDKKMKKLSIFSPGIKVMNKMTYARKFMLILLLFLIPFAVVLSMLISNVNERIQFAEKEREGIEYISELRSFVQLVQQHRGLSVTYVQGGTQVKGDIEARQESIAGIIEEIDDINDRLGNSLQAGDRWTALKQEWDKFHMHVFDFSTEETIVAHSQFIREIVDFQMYIATTSNLILDADKANYFLVGSLLEDLPNMAEYMGMSRATGTAVVNNKQMSTDEKITLLFNLRSMESYLNSSIRKLEFAFAASPEVKTLIEQPYKEAQEAALATIHLIDEEVLNASTINLDTASFFSTITESINQVYSLMDEGTSVLDDRLENQIQALKLQQAVVITISLFVTGLIVYFFIAFYFGVLHTITHIKEKMEQFADGDLTARTNLATKDETREIGIAFNKMSEEFNAIIVANKDISEQIAASSEELTASIDQTTEAIKQVTEIIAEVASGAEFQVSSSNESALASEEMAEGIQKIAETSAVVSDFSNQTTEKAKAGSIAVTNSMNQFKQVKKFVLNVSNTILELSNHSKEIGSITTLINGVAEQTNLLALNAAIEAARAGEHGKGFAVVADEVRKLAEETKTSTAKIANITSQVQDLTTHAVKAMEEGTVQVEAGTRVIESLGIDFDDILSSINEVSFQIHEVSAVSQQLSANSEEVAATMNELSKIAGDNSLSSQSVATSTEQQLATMEEINSSAIELSRVAQQLNDMINKFKL